jgi:threonine/homoserine/homoserine lactone efflux protein
MPSTANLLAFSLISLGMVLTPGPNMIYLVSRTLCQGVGAGFLSLAGVGVGFLLYMLAAAFGITVVLMSVPLAYDVLRWGGAAYLAYLAWQAIKPGGRAPFSVRSLPADPPWRLFSMGRVTNLLNPKIAVMYVSLLPQFIDPRRDDVLSQTLVLGTAQSLISLSVNSCITLMAGGVSRFLQRRPRWVLAQRWLMACVLLGLALRMANA